MPYILFTGLGPGQMTKNILNYIICENSITDFQCDGIARLFIQNLAVSINDNWLNGIKITSVGPTFC